MDKLPFIRFINIKCLVKTNFFPTFAGQKDKNDAIMKTLEVNFKDVVSTLQNVWDNGMLNDLNEDEVRNCSYELIEMYTDKVDELSEEEFNELTEMFVSAIKEVEL